MTVPDFTRGFPSPDPDAWEAAARTALGELFEADHGEGVATRVLYQELDAHPTAPPGRGDRVRGRTQQAPPGGFQVRHEYSDPDPTALARALAVDVNHGVEGVWIRLDPAIRWGGSPGAGVATRRVGAMLDCAPAMRDALAEVDPTGLPVFLEAGAAGPAVLANWRVALASRNLAEDAASGGILCDPISALAELGAIAQPFELAYITMADVVAHLCEAAPKVAAVGVSGCVWHDAGATAVQEVGFAIDSGIAYLRALERYRLSPADVAARMVFSFSVGPRPWPQLAKLRAARSLWSGVVARAGLDPTAHGMRLHARSSDRHLSRPDPWNNMLRATTAAFAGICGGAEGVAVTEFDAAHGVPEDFSRRMAINTALVLRHESGLHRVRDPAGGAYAVEALTRDIAERAWEVVQEVEERGGIVAALRDGYVQAQIRASARAEMAAVEAGQQQITGVTMHPPSEEYAGPEVRRIDRESAVRAAIRRRTTVLGDEFERAPELAALRKTLKKGEPADRVEAARACAAAGADAHEMIGALTDGGGRIVVEPLKPARLAEQAGGRA